MKLLCKSVKRNELDPVNIYLDTRTVWKLTSYFINYLGFEKYLDQMYPPDGPWAWDSTQMSSPL